MQKTSALYKALLKDPNHTVETIVKIDGVTYDKHSICNVKTTSGMFSGDDPAIGCCVARKINLTVLKPTVKIPTMAKIEPYVRLTNGKENSEYIPKGKFYIDTREEGSMNEDSDALIITGFCDMLRAEADCPTDGLNWPASDIQVLNLIASDMGVEIDTRTLDVIKNGYTIQIPTGYSEREVLSGIAAMYGGSFLMSDEGKLLFRSMTALPPEYPYLVDENGYAITFGGVKIVV